MTGTRRSAVAHDGDSDEAIEIEVTPAEAGERIDRILSARPLGLSRSRIQAWIGGGRVEVDGASVKASTRLARGDRVTLWPEPAETAVVKPERLPLAIVYEDADLVVVDKLAGMVVHPAPGHPGGTLVNALLHRVDMSGLSDPTRPGIVHRLDRGTTGLLVVAKTERAREALVAALGRRAVERGYLAIAQGHPPDEVTFDTGYGRHPRHRKRFSSRVEGGKRAVTHVRVVERLHRSSLVACRLETGRTHQIRVHFADHGYALLGDPVYGRASRDPRVREVAGALGRPALHAKTLAFAHPVSGARMCFNVEAPGDFAAALAALR